MEIKELAIKNFKGISALNFNPKKINIIVGRNNTSKTSVLEAINIIFNQNSILYTFSYLQEIIKINSKSAELSAKLENKKESINITYAEKDEIINELKRDLINFIKTRLKMSNLKESINNEELEKKVKEDILKIDLNKIKGVKIKRGEDEKIVYHSEKDEGISYLELDNVKKFLNEKLGIKSNLISILGFIPIEFKYYRYKKEVNEGITFIKDPLKIIKEESKIKIADIIQEVTKEHNLIPNLKRLEWKYILYNNNDSLSFDSMGDGLKAIINILYKIYEKKDSSIILLDEPENHMHPGYIIEFVKILIKLSKELNLQFFITTHDNDFIDSFLEKNYFSREDNEYIKKEILILQMGKINEKSYIKELSYNDAKESKEKFFLDLREV